MLASNNEYGAGLVWRNFRMNVRPISPYAHQLTRFGLLNAYLVRESDSFTLIDTTIGGASKAILAAARAIASGPIARILLTHAHGDHVGSVDALNDTLKAALGRVDVAISTRDAKLLSKPPNKMLEAGEPQGKIKGSLPGIRTAPTHLVNDGELFGSLRVITTPGHTPGHASFFDERDGTLYTGDALICMGGGLHVPGFGPWYFPLPALATWNKPLALESAEKLLRTLGADIRCYASGHGRLVQGGPELLQAAVDTAKLKLGKLGKRG